MLPTEYLDKAQKQLTSHWLSRDSHVSRVVEILAAAGLDPTGQKLLDIGCAQGREVALLNQIGIKAEGLDSNPEFVQQAKAQNPSLRFTLGDLLSLPAPFEPNTFDIVSCFNTLFYVDTVKALPCIRKLLRSGGIGIITLDEKIDDLDKRETIHSLDVDKTLSSLPESQVFFKNYAERIDKTPFHHKHHYYEIGFRAL